MSRTITIPHQHISFDGGATGTVRGMLVAVENGDAHGHLSIATQDGAHRYRAISGSFGREPLLSVQLEEIRTDPGTIELASIDIRLVGPEVANDAPAEASFTLCRLPDGGELFRATVRIVVQDEAQPAPLPAG